MRWTRGFLVAVLWTALVAAVASPAVASPFFVCTYGEFWKGQTALVRDINPGPADAADALFGYSARNGLMAAYEDALYFQADDGQTGAELWRAEGAETSRVADVAPGAAGSRPHSFAEFQGKLYFAASRPATGEELYRYDGVAPGIAVEIAPGAEGGEIAGLTEYDGALYFTRWAKGGQKVWRFDGVTAKAVDAINGAPGSVDDRDLVGSAFLVFKNRLYFVKQAGPPENYQLWAYDGSVAKKIKALAEGKEHLTSYDFHLGVHEGALFFGVVTGPSLERKDELWRYTGQGAPVKVATLGDAWSGSQPQDFQTYREELYFGSGVHLFRFDGTAVHPLDVGPGGLPFYPRGMTLFSSADQLYLTGFYEDDMGREPYTFDGATVALLQNIMPDDAAVYPGSFPTYAVEVGDSLYFYAKDEAHGRELWRVTTGEKLVSLKPLHCDVVLADIWFDWPVWGVDRREVVVSNWLFGLDARPRLLSREVVTAVRGKEARFRVLELDPRRERLPQGFALATIVFDRETGAPVDRGFKVLGTPSPALREELRRAAAELVTKRSLEDVMAAPVSKYEYEAPLPAPAADPVVLQVPPAPAAGPTCGAAAAPAVRDSTPEWLEMACCGNRCSSDSQCTVFCGGPGQCVQVNSCCRRCICSQT